MVVPGDVHLGAPWFMVMRCAMPVASRDRCEKLMPLPRIDSLLLFVKLRSDCALFFAITKASMRNSDLGGITKSAGFSSRRVWLFSLRRSSTSSANSTMPSFWYRISDSAQNVLPSKVLRRVQGKEAG